MWLQKFLWWCAGVEGKILENYPTEWSKYFGIGGTILFTALMASFAGGYAFYTAFKDIPFAIFFALFWGALIFNLDRYIVSTIGKGDGTPLITRQEWKNALPRIILAVLIGFVIATPLELKVFEKEIGVEIKKIINEKRQQMTSGLDDIRNEQERLKIRIDDLEADTKSEGDEYEQDKDPRITIKKAEKLNLSEEFKKLEKNLQPINSEISTLRSQLKAAYSNKAKTPSPAIDDLIRKYENRTAKLEQQENSLKQQLNITNKKIQNIENKIGEIRSELGEYYGEGKKRGEHAKKSLKAQIIYLDSVYNSKAKEYSDVSTQYDGFMAQLEALDRLSISIDTIYTYPTIGAIDTSSFQRKTGNQSTPSLKPSVQFSKHWTVVFYAKWLITLLLIAIEIAPIMFKMMTESGPYDDRFEEIKYESEVKKKKFISDLNQQINTELIISSESNKKRIEAELGTNAELLNQITQAQIDVISAAIASWKEKQMKIAEDNPEFFVNPNKHQNNL